MVHGSHDSTATKLFIKYTWISRQKLEQKLQIFLDKTGYQGHLNLNTEHQDLKGFIEIKYTQKLEG